MKATVCEIDVRVDLLSDMCCGTGENTGIHLDQVTATDSSGLPIIPGKRLKGLLKDSASVLTKHGYANGDVFTGLFGSSGGRRRGKLEIMSAELSDSAAIRQGLTNAPGIYLPGQVTQVFTTTRSHTKIDQLGIAKNHSLRTNQVVSKIVGDQGVSFGFTVRITDPSEDDIKLFEAAVKTLRHIGLNKNRGYGEVKCTTGEQRISVIDFSAITLNPSGQTVTTPYTITLQQDVVVSGNAKDPFECFSGGALLGAFARYTSDEPWFESVILNNTIFSNAYPVACGESDSYQSCYPIPFSFQMEKNAGIGRGASEPKVYAQLDGFKYQEGKQYVPFRGCGNWDGDALVRTEAATAYSFHNATAASDMGKQYFSLRTVKAGQVFSGTITADASAIEVLRKVLVQLGNRISLGASTSAQFAGCLLQIDQISDERRVDKSTATTFSGDVIVECLSDVILIDSLGRNTVAATDLLDALGSYLTFDASKAVVYSKVTTIGGYNAQWQLHRRQFVAFQKGTTILLPDCCERELESAYLRLGSQTNEGYGLIRLRQPRQLVAGLSVRHASSVKPLTESRVSVDNRFRWLVTQIRLNAAKIDMAAFAAETETNKLSNISKSSAMRVGVALRAVLMSGNLHQEDILDAFKQYKENKFSSDEDLSTLCDDAATKFMQKFTDLGGSAVFAVEAKNELFRTFLAGYIRVLKIHFATIDKPQPGQAEEVSVAQGGGGDD